MGVKFYRLFCEICNYKRITDGSDVDDLKELKISPIPGGIPVINKLNGKVETPKPIKRIKQFRCPKCGRVLIPRKVIEPLLPLQPDEVEEQKVEDLKAPLGIKLELPGEEPKEV